MAQSDIASLVTNRLYSENTKVWQDISGLRKKGLKMTGLIYLLMCFVYFFCVGLDVAMFFLQIRLVLLWRNVGWLVPFDNAGKTIVSAVTRQTSKFVKTKRPLSDRGKLIVALLVFAIIRLILGTILRQT